MADMPTVTVSIETATHAAIAKLVREVYEVTGVRVTRIDVDWFGLNNMGGERVDRPRSVRVDSWREE